MKIRCDEFDIQPIFPAGGFVTLTEDQVEAHCVAPFQGSVRRPLLMTNLRRWIDQLRSIGVHGDLWVDGSFLTMRPEPDDVDVVFLIDSTKSKLIPNNIPAANFLLDRQAMKQQYHIEVLALHKGQNIEHEAKWMGWFGFCRDRRTPKGFAEVMV